MIPVLFEIGGLEVRSYTVCMALAIGIGCALTYREARRRLRFDDRMAFVGAMGVAGGIIGAKASMVVFLGPSTFWELRGSIASYGAAMAGALFGGYVLTVVAESLLRVPSCAGDLAAPFIPLGQAIGRLGNFLSGDAYGSPSNLPWAVLQDGVRRHPAQLYELGLDLLLFGFLYRYRLRSFRDGELFRMYMVGYAVIRFPLEFLRYQPTPRDTLGLTLVQWLCLGSFAFFGYQLVLIRRGVPCICAIVPRFRRAPEALR